MTSGRLHRTGDHWQIVFTRHLRHAPDRVWRAITEPDHVRAWFPNEIHGERRPGARLRFTFPDEEKPAFDGEMLAWDPPRTLAFRWGADELRFELEPDGDATILTLTDTIEEQGRAARDAAGWHESLDLLAAELDEVEPDFGRGERRGQVHRLYVDEFGPFAAAIGPPRT